jgi:hypothetical protein
MYLLTSRIVRMAIDALLSSTRQHGYDYTLSKGWAATLCVTIA